MQSANQMIPDGKNRMKILLIEDSRFLRLAIEKVLSRVGYEVTGVADGQEGLSIARAAHPGLILLDMMLPGLDGTCVLKELKKEPSTAKIPVIVLTGLSQANEAKLKNAGAAAYCQKTMLNFENNSDALIRVIESVVGPSSKMHSAVLR